jgi:hypothetical protein
LPPCEEEGNRVAGRTSLLQCPLHRSTRSSVEIWGAADLIAEGDYVVGRWEGGGTHTGPRSAISWPAPCARVPVGKCDLPVRLF